ncbi:hypothetical protein [Priestia megaterium]|uniref:hypothetical protein n=1 Tax=Priestia megaterium TaxID=1404 RepID=UPI0031FDA75E
MLEIRAEQGDTKLEIKLDNSNESVQSTIISSIFNSLFSNGETVSLESSNKGVLIEEFKEEEQKIAVYKDGYQALQSEQVGVHNPKSEFEPEEQSKNPHGTDFSLGKKVVDGEERFQTFYRCTQCATKGKYFLPKGRIYCTCKECGKRMRIREAAANGKQDEFGNYYIAGDFKRSMYDKEQDEKFEKSVV